MGTGIANSELQVLVFAILVGIGLLVAGMRTRESYRWAMIFAGGIFVIAAIIQLVQPHHS